MDNRIKHLPSEIIKKYKSLSLRIKASIWFLVCSFLQKGISVLTTPVFTRLLSTDEYGEYGVFNSWLSIITIIVSFKLSAGVYTQAVVKMDDKRAEFTSAMQGLNLTLCVAWTCIYFAFREFWNGLLSLTTIQMTIMLIMVWIEEAYRFWMREQQVKLNYKMLVIITLIISLLKPVIGIVFVINAEDKVLARILAFFLVELMVYPVMFIIHMKRGKVFFSGHYWKYALLFNLPLVPHYLSQIVLSSSDRIMIERLVGSSEAGIYTLAYSVSSIMVLFNTAFAQTIDPWSYQRLKDKKGDEIPPISYSALSLVAIVNTILIAFAPEAIALFAPKEYYDAIWVIPPVSMSTYFMFAYGLFSSYGFYYQKTKFIMVVSVFGAAMNIVLNWLFIPIFGYVAAGYTTLACYMAYSIGHFVLMKWICKKEEIINYYNWKTLIAITLIFMGSGFVFLATYKWPVIRYSIIGIFIICLIVFRKRILKVLNSILELRKINKSFS